MRPFWFKELLFDNHARNIALIPLGFIHRALRFFLLASILGITNCSPLFLIGILFVHCLWPHAGSDEIIFLLILLGSWNWHIVIFTPKKKGWTCVQPWLVKSLKLASSDSSALECHSCNLVLSEATIAARVAIFDGNQRWPKLYQSSINGLSRCLKTEKAARGIQDRSECAIILSVHILWFPEIIELPYLLVKFIFNKKLVRNSRVTDLRFVYPVS